MKVIPPLRSDHLIGCLGLLGAATTGLVLAVNLIGGKPNSRAVVLMATGLVVIWVIAGGLLMRRFRDPVRTFILAHPWPWKVKFVLFCTGLALAEEAITTSMTNLAPLFGVPVGKAYITASTNYFDVVGLHSVVVFVPMFIGWAWMLGKWNFQPNVVFLIFGLTGTLAEMSFGGPQQLLAVGFWSFVYGLMIYLPAYSIPADRGVTEPRWWHHFVAVLLPFLFAAPVAGVVSALHPVKIHFPPLQPDT